MQGPNGRLPQPSGRVRQISLITHPNIQISLMQLFKDTYTLLAVIAVFKIFSGVIVTITVVFSFTLSTFPFLRCHGCWEVLSIHKPLSLVQHIVYSLMGKGVFFYCWDPGTCQTRVRPPDKKNTSLAMPHSACLTLSQIGPKISWIG